MQRERCQVAGCNEPAGLNPADVLFVSKTDSAKASRELVRLCDQHRAEYDGGGLDLAARIEPPGQLRIRVDARWKRDTWAKEPRIDPAKPSGAGWLIDVDDDGTYVLQLPSGAQGRMEQVEAETVGLELREGGDIEGPWLAHDDPKTVALVRSLLEAADAGG